MPKQKMNNMTVDFNRLFCLLKRAVSTCLFLFFVSISLSNAQAEVTIIDVRTGLHPSKTRIVLEVSKATYYQIQYHQNTGEGDLLERYKEITIDLQEAPAKEAFAALAKNAVGIGVLDHIKIEDNEGAVRLRIFLRKAASIDKSFVLKPDHGRQFRIVFDLKAISKAEWSRLVKLTTPPVSEQKMVIAPTPTEPLSLDTTGITKADPREEQKDVIAPEVVSEGEDADTSFSQEENETYDDVMTGDSNFTLSGYIEIEARGFTQSSINPISEDWTVSFALEPLLEYVSDTSSSQIMFRPFGRLDVQDNKRSHFDIRELKWTGTWDRIQMTVGIDTVFWGVTESNHLVDILNQDDNLEDIDQEDKLGQPMISVSYDSDFGVLSAYLMTYFRERRYPGSKGRFQMPLPIDYSQTQYQAGSDKWHADWAVRWAHVIGNFDLGLYHFRGTNREPVFVTGIDGTGNAVLIPRYNLINQTGFDAQATFEDLLFKFEAIRRSGSGSDFWAMTGGVEYTLYGIGDGDSDIGLLAEYLYDDRGGVATTPFEDDLFMGMRWAANDIDSTEFLLGAIFDLDTSAKFINLEGSRRIGDNWKITLDARFFLGIPITDPVYPQSRDDFFQVRLARYF